MPLPENLKDQTDTLYDITVVKQIVSSTNDGWGYGVKVNSIIVDSFTPTITFHTSEANAIANTGGISATPVTTTPTTGQVKINYAHPTKLSWIECSGADDGKWLRIVCKAQGDLWDAFRANETNTQVNTNATNIANNTTNITDHETRIATLEAAGGGSGVTPSATLSPANGATGQAVGVNITATWNKWLDDDITDKLKLYPTSADRTANTNAIAGTLSRTSNKVMTFDPTVDVNDNNQYFARIFSGLKFADGTSLEDNLDWTFVVGTLAGNQAPTASPTISGTTILGSTLTANAGYSDLESDPAGTHLYQWYRDSQVSGATKSSINGATNSTYVIAEADIGKYLFCEVTPVATLGTSPGDATLSSGTNIPVPSPPSIEVTAGVSQNTISFTANSTLSTESYDLYWLIDAGSPTADTVKSTGTKITGVTSPHIHTGLTGSSKYNYVLTMKVNNVESTPSAVANGTPTAEYLDANFVPATYTTTYGFGHYSNGHLYLQAQQVTIGRTGNLTKIDLDLFRSTSGVENNVLENIICDVYSDSGNNPGTLLGSTGEITGFSSPTSLVSGSPNWKTGTCNIAVTNGQKLWLIPRGVGTQAFYGWGASSAGYSGGLLKYNDNGGAYQSLSEDQSFRIYVTA